MICARFPGICDVAVGQLIGIAGVWLVLLVVYLAYGGKQR